MNAPTKPVTAAQFHKEPLRFLDQTFPDAGAAAWLPGRELLVGDPAAAREVLANQDGLYEEHSDFFHTRKGMFGPRSVQEEIGRASRDLLRSRLKSRAAQLPDTVQQTLGPLSHWPDAGNRLIHRLLSDALLCPSSPAPLRRKVDEVVERAVLAGARERHSLLSRAMFRFLLMRSLAQEIEARRARKADTPVDVLDILAAAAEPHVPASELAEIFLSFVFAVAGSVGFVLGWSLYLLGRHPQIRTEPAWIVREALRLWPVAWMLVRRPAQPHEVAGHAVTPDDEVAVCPYAVHRSPQHWSDPDSFQPERWATAPDQSAYIPFGWGEHRCVAAALSLQLVEDVLRVLLDEYRMTFTFHETQPHIGPALAPPRFTLGLEPLPLTTL